MIKKITSRLTKVLKCNKGMSEFLQFIIVIPIVAFFIFFVVDVFVIANKWYNASKTASDIVRVLNVQGGTEKSKPASYPYASYLTPDDIAVTAEQALGTAGINCWEVRVDGNLICHKDYTDDAAISDIPSLNIPIRTDYNLTLTIYYDWNASGSMSLLGLINGEHTIARPGLSEWD